MVKLYDDALIKKLNDWTQDTDIHIYNSDSFKSVISMQADTSGDKSIKLPIVVLRRSGGYQITNFNKRPLTYDGLTLDATESRSIQLNAIPIRIDYQLDIYAKYLEEADIYAREFVFNFINFPTVPVTIPYNNQSIIHNSTVRISDVIEDNSDIPERMVPGQFTRLTLSLNIDDAYLWDVRARNTVKIGNCGLYIYKDELSDDYVKEDLYFE